MTQAQNLARRGFLAGASSLLAPTAAGCATTTPTASRQAALPPPIPDDVVMMYRAFPEEQFSVPAVDLHHLRPEYFRRRVQYTTTERPGTVIVDTASFYLYHVEEGGTAMRYGTGLGRAGFEWSGRGHVAYTRDWPVWTPPPEMIARQPELEQWRRGHPPGLDNPLGARALYIHEGNRDTLYRIHGTEEVWTIGQAVSSGCVRLINQDVIDLAGRVKSGSTIVVA